MIAPEPVRLSSVSVLSVPVAFTSVNEPAAFTFAPIVVPSIAPPLISTESEAIVVNVPAAEVVPPTATPSMLPLEASISTTPSTSKVLPAATVISKPEIVLPAPPERFAESIVPPETLSPLIWSFARVKVPLDKSTEPPVIATEPEFCTAIEPKPKFERAVVLPEASDASTPKPPFAIPSAPETASEDVKFTAPYATPFEPSESSA